MYDFYLADQQLPITPGKLTTNHDGKNKVYTLINDTEINIPKPVKLLTYNFQCIIPHQVYPFAQPSSASILASILPNINGIFPFDNFANLFKPQKYWMLFFETLHESQAPFTFRIERYIGNGNHINTRNAETNLKNVSINTDTGEISLTSYNTVMHVTLENYKAVEDAADGMAGLDYLVDLTLKQAVQYGTIKYTLQAVTDDSGNAVTNDDGTQQYKAIPQNNRPTWNDEDVQTSSESGTIITRTDSLSSTFESLMYG